MTNRVVISRKFPWNNWHQTNENCHNIEYNHPTQKYIAIFSVILLLYFQYNCNLLSYCLESLIVVHMGQSRNVNKRHVIWNFDIEERSHSNLMRAT
jgi:hypothetical protein